MAFTINLNRGGMRSNMSLIDHLEDLRGLIIRSVMAVLLMGIIFFIYRNWIFDNIITGPIHGNFITYRAFCKLSHWLNAGNALCLPPVQISMQSTTFSGQFISSITMAFAGGFLAAFPYIFWEFWRFIKPALKEKELRGTRFVVFWVSFFFFCGACFGFFLLGPFTFNFLAGFQLGDSGLLVTKPTLSDYLENLTNLILGCGIAFELPVLAYVLTRIGLITPGLLRKSRRYAIIIILIVAAVITPSPDWMSQMIVFVPLWILYELSITISSKVHKDMLTTEVS